MERLNVRQNFQKIPKRMKFIHISSSNVPYTKYFYKAGRISDKFDTNVVVYLPKQNSQFYSSYKMRKQR